MKEALFYEKTGSSVRCHLCRFHCTIADGKRGICNVRENRSGILYSLVFGKVVAENIDPVEKKPLFHFMPGSKTFSIATAGCNFHCLQCQNWNISQTPKDANIPGIDRSPAEVVHHALNSGCSSISYTYTEPTIFYEFALETATLAKANGLGNIFVSNGYICKAPLELIAPVLNAANIDLKGLDEKKYPQLFGGRLSEVLDAIVEYKRLGIWLELTTLVIPGVNDSDEELLKIAMFIKEYLGNDTPWHLSRFYPTYKMVDISPTPAKTLIRGAELGRSAGLRHVYIGNLSVSGGENSFCHDCQRVLIVREGFSVVENSLADGCCPHCGARAAGVWG
ncbi:MAG: AmmeMemoRadiSam system radical SAM enzyme [Geobacteraceae bacterium]|nr:AmmeMemoRadiSam system radical SAM enzyme [Geobacteraceae bacterium]